jgi:hypothetical protein
MVVTLLLEIEYENKITEKLIVGDYETKKS